ncbi:MAG: LysM peptidoglycan-binding domain-containing M23 family metallopeptidase [Candidatus Omnitrophota bacterium]
MKRLKNIRFCYVVLIFGFWILDFVGCASAPYVKPPVAAVPAGMTGVYHRVEKGQTLWRISRMYNVDLDEMARINRITDTANIEAGQQIFIPNRQKPQSFPANYFSDDFIWPLKGRVISFFGRAFNNIVNKGINIEPYASLNVVASRSGRVVFYSESFGSYGKTLIIEHGDGFSTVYARNAEIFVKPGDTVPRGFFIAKAGSAGRDKSEYLHFEIRKGHIPQNPYFYLPR